MKRSNWFQRNTLPVRVRPNCECRSLGRDFCHDCCQPEEKTERDPIFSAITQYPSWWDSWTAKNVLTRTDIDFLEGRKPVFKPRRRYECKPFWKN